MSEEKEIPANKEHLEAMQFYLDKERYKKVAEMSPEEQATFAKMEQAVVQLIDMKRPFVLLAAPTKDDGQFWRYQSYTQQDVPLPEGEAHQIAQRSTHALIAHASHWAYMMGCSVVFYDKERKPMYACTPEGDINNTKFEGEAQS